MKYFLLDQNGNALPSRFIINSKTGRAIGEIKYRVPDNQETITSEGWATYKADSLTVHEEDVGDMIRSNYLIIED